MSDEAMKTDTVLTVNWLRVNVPTIAAVVVFGVTIGTWLASTDKTAAQNAEDIATLKAQLAKMETVPYRIGQAEIGIRAADRKIDNLSNTIIGQMDLMRQDVNRLTTGIEVLSFRVGALTGDVKPPPPARRPPAVRVQTPE